MRQRARRRAAVYSRQDRQLGLRDHRARVCVLRGARHSEPVAHADNGTFRLQHSNAAEYADRLCKSKQSCRKQQRQYQLQCFEYILQLSKRHTLAESPT